MNTYTLLTDWNGIPKGTQIFGPAPLLGSSLPAYFTKENLPAEGQFGSNGFFKTSVENNPDTFKLIVE